jgi:CheY-like chemotaxis protein
MMKNGLRTQPARSERATILVVDDDPGVREVLEMVLSDEGYRVASAGDGREALAYLAHEEAPDLVLLDIMMPVMDGYEFRAAQRDDPLFSAIPIVVLSAGESSARVTAMDAAAVLKKPFDIDALLAVVEKVCRALPPAARA